MALSRILLCSLIAILSASKVVESRSSEGDSVDKSHRVAITTEEHVDEDYNYYDGDIILTDWQKELLGLKRESERRSFAEEVQAHDVNRRAVVSKAAYLWPNGVVPYVLDDSLNSAAERAIMSAIKEYEDKTCIQFVQRTSQTSYIRFLKDRGCYSYIGRTGAAGQAISIGNGCEYKGIVIHEIFHALGRWHEQSRPDRDSYIVVNYENIISSVTNNFKRVGSNVATTQGITYDLRSIMHYDAYAFSKNGRPTIVPKSSRVKLSSIGQREDFTDSDLQHVNRLYDCPNQPPGGDVGSWSSWLGWSSCSVTCGGGLQTRTRTCVGSGCTGQSRQSRNCNTGGCPQASSWGQWGSWSSCSSTCGSGYHTRTRTCQGTRCSGSRTQRRSCNSKPCPTTGSSGWGPWGKWTPCAVTCGGGLKFRWRRCLSFSLAGCRSGKSYELEHCGPRQCPPALDPTVHHTLPSYNNHGVKHICCEQLTVQSDHLSVLSLPNVVSSIISGPFPTGKVREECFHLAKSLNYSFIGIMGKYCVSVDGDFKPSKGRVYAGVCKDGTGLYDPSSVTQYMDVYMINSTDSANIISQGNVVVKSPHSIIRNGAPSGMGMGLVVAFIAAGILTLMLT